MAKVPSTTRMAPASRASSAAAAMSLSLMCGLEGVSSQMQRVVGRSASRTFSIRLASTTLTSRPQRGPKSRAMVRTEK